LLLVLYANGHTPDPDPNLFIFILTFFITG
jgi:hypothetical protein